MAQNLTFEEAKQLTHKLHQIEILSKKGEEKLLQDLKNKPEYKTYRVFVLEFLYHAFYNDFMYRSGMNAREEFMEKNRVKYENITSTNTTEEERAKIEKEIQEELKKQEWYKIELAIEDEEERDTLQESQGYLIFPSLSGVEEHSLVHKKRSVLGKTFTRTLHEIFEIGLVDSLVFEDLEQFFKKKKQ